MVRADSSGTNRLLGSGDPGKPLDSFFCTCEGQTRRVQRRRGMAPQSLIQMKTPGPAEESVKDWDKCGGEGSRLPPSRRIPRILAGSSKG